MKKNKQIAFGLIFVAILVLLYFLLPFKFHLRKSELQLTSFEEGKIEFTIQVNLSKALDQDNEKWISYIKEFFVKKGLSDITITQLNGKIEIASKEDEISANMIKAFIKENDCWEQEAPVSSEEHIKYILSLSKTYRKELENDLVKRTIPLLEDRLDCFGFDDFSIDLRDSGVLDKPSEILILIPIVKDINQIRNELTIGYMEFTEVIGDPAESENQIIDQYAGKLPDRTWIGEGKEGNKQLFYLLKSIPILTGSDVKNARLSADSNNGPAVSVSLKSICAIHFSEYTENNRGKRLAIVFDKEVISAPIIAAILSDSMIITGSFALEEATKMALLLRKGGLPAELKIVKERTIKLQN